MNENEEKKKKRKQIIIRACVSLLIIGAIIGLAYWGFSSLGLTKLTKEQLQEYIKKTGVWGPLVFILISFLQVTFVPIPGAITIIAGSFLFGAGLSFLYSYIGMLLGALVAFLLGRLIGKPFVYWVAGDKDSVDNYLKRMKGKEKVVLFFMFLFPFFPDDLLCSVAGILPISWLSFFLMQLVTRLSSIGGTLIFMSGELIPYDKPWGIALIVFFCLLGVAAFLVSYKYSDWINAKFDTLMNKISRKKPGEKDQTKELENTTNNEENNNNENKEE